MFWKSWPLGDKILLYTLFIIFFCGFFHLGTGIYQGDDIFTQWDLKGQIEILTHPLMSFSQDFFEFIVPADSFILINRFVPTAPQLQAMPYTIALGMYLVGLLVIFTSATYLSGFSYLTALVIWVLGVAAFDFDDMGIYFDFLPEEFMQGKKAKLYLYLVLGTFLPINFLLQNFENKISYGFRFLIFSILASVFTYLLIKYGTVQQPSIHCFNYGMSVPIFACLVFMSFAAHEPIRAFLVMVGSNGTRGYRQWMVFSIVYLLNLIYVYLYYNYGLDWGIYFLDPFLMVGFTCLVGIWGTYARRNQFDGIIESPYAVFMFLGLSLVLISQLSLAVHTANDPLISLYRSIILVSHVGFGLAFVFYILLNFKELFDAYQPVYKVAFNPKKVDFWLIWTFGLIVLFGAFFGRYKQTYHSGVSASYNIIGTNYYLSEDLKQAKENWVISQRYSPFGRFNNYMLATLSHREKQKPFLTAEFIKNISARKTRPPDYAFISEMYADDELKLFQAIFALQEGITRFPKSGELHNNLALLYNRTNLGDSVWKFFEKARNHIKQPEIIEANYFALWAKYRFDTSLDTLYSMISPKRYLGTLANEAGFLNVIGKNNPKPLALDLLPENALDTKALIYLYNLALNEAHANDSLLAQKIESYLFNGKNTLFQTNLQVALAVLNFKKGKIDFAFSLMEQAVEGSGAVDAFTPYVLGCWLVLAGQYERAIQHLSMAYARGNADATLPLAVAYTHTQNPKAIQSWEFLAQTQPKHAETAKSMLNVLYSNKINPNWSDLEKYYALRFGKWSEKEEINLLNFIQNKTYFNQYCELRVADAKNASQAKQFYDLIAQPSVETRLAYKRWQKEFDDEYASLLDKDSVSVYRQGHIEHYRALYHQYKGDSSKAAISFEKALDLVPLKESLYSDAVSFYRNNPQKVYELLLKGLRLMPKSATLLQEYILVCFELKLDHFAQASYKDWLKLNLPKEEFESFNQIYQQKLQASEQMPEGWE